MPGQVIHRKQPRGATAPPDLDHTLLPDLVGVSLHALLTRIQDLEAKAGSAGAQPGPAPRLIRGVVRPGLLDLTE